MNPPAPSASPARPRPAASFLIVLAGVSLFLLYQFVASVIRLSQGSGAMKNKFSAYARSEFIGYLIGQNALMLVAYLILAIAGAIILQPFVAPLAARLKLRKKLPLLILGWFGAYLIHTYFTLRLVDTRPYFLPPEMYGNAFYHIFDFIPANIRPSTDYLIFKVLPYAVLFLALTWHLRRLVRKKYAAALIVLVIFASVFGISRFQNASSKAVAKSTGKPNILILSSDSLRGDRLGVSGYRPARSDGMAAAGTSPVIDGLAKDSVNFQTCYAQIGSTLESTTSFMASQYPHTHGLRYMFADGKALAAAQQRTVPMAKILRENGYDTAAIGDWCAGVYDIMPLGFEHIAVSSFDNFKIYMSQAVVMAHFVVPLYFDNAVGYKIFPQLNSFASFVTPEVVNKRVEARLGEVAKINKPFFWHVFYSCTHLPYSCPEPYSKLFADPSYKGPHQNQVAFDADAFSSSKDLEAKLAAMPAADRQQVNALYDGCIRQFDDCVKRALDALKKNGLAENTIVIITGDHGDDLFEPGVTLLHGQGFNGGLQTNHVPMVFHVPGIPAKAIPETVRLIDVMPTLADFAGVPKPASWEGKSFAGWIKGTQAPEWRPFYGETGFPFMQPKVAGVTRPQLPPMDEMTFIDPETNDQFVLKPEYHDPLIAAKQRCLRTRYWKLVCTPAADGTRHFGLFHFATDPNGRTDLAASRPEVLAPLQAALIRWIDEKRETSIPEIFPAGEPE